MYLAVVAAFATKELYDEIVTRITVWRWKKEREDFEVWLEQMEDEEADDEEYK